MKNLQFASLIAIFVSGYPLSGEPGSAIRKQKSPLSWGGFSFGGERGIRTPGSVVTDQRFSRPPHSTALPFLHFFFLPSQR
jgi:hypothetical protein